MAADPYNCYIVFDSGITQTAVTFSDSSTHTVTESGTDCNPPNGTTVTSIEYTLASGYSFVSITSSLSGMTFDTSSNPIIVSGAQQTETTITLTTSLEFIVDGIKYSNSGMTSGTVKVIANSYSGDITIPSTVTYNSVTYSVTEVGTEAFKDCTGLTSIVIGNNVTTIGASAFYECTALTSITIGTSVSTFNAVDNRCYTFYRCTAVTELNFNSNAVTENIGCKYIFSELGTSGTGVTVTFGSTVTAVPQGMFYDSYVPKITSAVFSDSVTTIKRQAFNSCSYLKSLTFGSGITTIESVAFLRCTALTSIIIPDTVTSIGASAFSHCSSLTSVSIGSGLTTIPAGMFGYCTALESIVIPSNITAFNGSGVFSGCTALKTIRMESTAPPSCYSDTFQIDSLEKMYVHLQSLSAYQTASNYPSADKIYPIETLYEKITYNGCKVQTDSAIRDGLGHIIANLYLPATKCTYQTTPPTADITDGGVHIVYLTEEPSNKYEGYIYIIAEE